MSKVNIYILKLQEGKYYVGRSYNVPKRLNQHYNGEGSVWTKKYKPICLYKVFLNKTKFDEDKYTMIYMSIYGIDNVRGGSFCSIELGGADKYIIKRMICNATDKCVKCEKHGHYFTDCPLYKIKKNKKIKQNIKINIDNSEDYDSECSEITEKSGVSDYDSECSEITEKSEESNHNLNNYLTRSKKRKL